MQHRTQLFSFRQMMKGVAVEEGPEKEEVAEEAGVYKGKFGGRKRKERSFIIK